MTVKTPLTLISGPDGCSLLVRLLPEGARVSRGGGIVKQGNALIEFYDASHADDGEGGRGFGPLGQFVSDYYLSQLLRGHDPAAEVREPAERGEILPGLPGRAFAPGLDLCGGVYGWSVSHAEVMRLMRWAETVAPAAVAQARLRRDATNY